MNKLLENINGWTQSGPMGNDKQIWGMIGTALAGKAVDTIFGNNRRRRQQQNTFISPDQIAEYMKPGQEMISQMQSQAQDYMDPNSQFNVQQRGRMEQQGMNQLALQGLMKKRQAAASGLDPGILSAQGRMDQGQMAASLRDQYASQMDRNRQLGQGLLGQAFGGQMKISENIAQSAIAQNQGMRNQANLQQANQGSFWGGLASGVGDFLGTEQGGQFMDNTGQWLSGLFNPGGG